jgi:protein-disulfide isomerase
MNKISLAVIVGALLLTAGCDSNDDQFKQKVTTVLKENPEIIFDAIKERPMEFVGVLQVAMDAAKQELAEKTKESEEEALKQLVEKHLAEPLQPAIREDEAIRGSKSAPLVLVEYSDFECPFCSRGYSVVSELMERYGDQLQFVYKHLPLSFHQHAMTAAKYYEALRLQDQEKAFAFHDELFANQAGLQQGDSFLKATAKKVGADMKKLAADIESDKVKQRIAEDVKEAESFGFNGTPAFTLNGIPVLGAYPVEHFEMLIGKLEEQGKVALKKEPAKPVEGQ